MKNTFLLPLITGATGETLNVMDLIAQAGWVVKFVMFLLILASVLSWTIIFWKWFILRKASSKNDGFCDSFWAIGSIEKASSLSKSYTNAPLAAVYDAGLHEFNQIKSLKLKRDEAIELLETNLTRSLTKAANIETAGLHSYIPFLANTASTAPFVGLFGTVWGIMTAFINIGATGASNLAVVAPGIAEALIATALGLSAAIPAVIFYNYFVHGVKEVSAAMENFAADFINLAKRSI